MVSTGLNEVSISPGYMTLKVVCHKISCGSFLAAANVKGSDFTSFLKEFPQREDQNKTSREIPSRAD